MIYPVLLRCLYLLSFFIGRAFPFTGLRADPLDLPFSPGEEISYNIRWQQVKAGTCSIKVLPFTRVNNTLAFHFQMAAKSNKFVT